MEIEITDFGVKVVKCCASCKDRVFCAHANAGKRGYVCSSWEMKDFYRLLCSGRTLAGVLSVPGQVKRPEYLRWVADNSADLPINTSERIAIYREEKPGVKVYWNE